MTRAGVLWAVALLAGSCAEAPEAGAPGLDLQPHLAAGGVSPPGAEPANPFAGDSTSAAEGARLFVSMNCDGCHGGGATGFIAPSLSDGRWRYGGSDGAVFQSIYGGRPQGMPAFGGVLQAPIIWKLVAYLKSLSPPVVAPTQSW